MLRKALGKANSWLQEIETFEGDEPGQSVIFLKDTEEYEKLERLTDEVAAVLDKEVTR